MKMYRVQQGGGREVKIGRFCVRNIWMAPKSKNELECCCLKFDFYNVF